VDTEGVPRPRESCREIEARSLFSDDARTGLCDRARVPLGPAPALDSARAPVPDAHIAHDIRWTQLPVPTLVETALAWDGYDNPGW